jgi:hypothetical protein
MPGTPGFALANERKPFAWSNDSKNREQDRRGQAMSVHGRMTWERWRVTVRDCEQ